MVHNHIIHFIHIFEIIKVIWNVNWKWISVNVPIYSFIIENPSACEKSENTSQTNSFLLKVEQYNVLYYHIQYTISTNLRWDNDSPWETQLLKVVVLRTLGDIWSDPLWSDPLWCPALLVGGMWSEDPLWSVDPLWVARGDIWSEPRSEPRSDVLSGPENRACYHGKIIIHIPFYQDLEWENYSWHRKWINFLLFDYRRPQGRIPRRIFFVDRSGEERSALKKLV